MPRIAFYFDNHDSLGHATVVLALVKALKNIFGGRCRIVVIESGSRRTGLFPFSDQGSYLFIKRQCMNDPFIDGKMIKNAYAGFKGCLGQLDPDLFITEYYPFFLNPPFRFLPNILENLKAKKTKIISACTFMNWTKGLSQELEELYDLVFFHWPKHFRRLFDLSGASNEKTALETLLSKYRRKIIETGFVMERLYENNSDKNGPVSGIEKRIVISRGGLSAYPQLIGESMRLAKKHKDWHFLISTGYPENSNKFKRLREYAKGSSNIRLKNIIYPDFDNYLKNAALSVSLCGYNTMVQLMFYGKKCIVLPVKNTEQILNSRVLSGFLPCRVLSEKTLRAELEPSIEELVSNSKNTRNHIDSNWFFGAQNTARLIKQYV